MTLFAMAAPILPGKTDQWRRFADELSGPRRGEYEASRRRLGVHERAFLQQTPHGDIVIVTLEGDNPAEAFFGYFASATDDFTRWFVQEVKEIHGLDLTQPAAGPMPHLVLDTEPDVKRRAA